MLPERCLTTLGSRSAEGVACQGQLFLAEPAACSSWQVAVPLPVSSLRSVGICKLRLLTCCSLTACRDAEKAEKLKKDNEKSEEKLPADANA